MGGSTSKNMSLCCDPVAYSPRPLKHYHGSKWHLRTFEIERLSEYEVLQELTSGADSTLLEVRHRRSGRLFCCKSILKQNMALQGNGTNNSEFVHKEVDILEHLSSQHTVSIHEVIEEKARYHLIMELLLGGDLMGQAPLSGTYSEADASLITRCAAACLHHCHVRNVVHRNVNPASFFWTWPHHDSDQNSDAWLKKAAVIPSKRVLKLASFEHATFLEGDRQQCSSMRGSYLHAAPEMVRKHRAPKSPSVPGYGAPVDMWALGVMLYGMLSGRMPFVRNSQDSTLRSITSDPVDLESAPWPKLSVEAKHLVAGLLRKDPSTRYTAQEVLKHPFVTSLRPQDARVPSNPLRASTPTDVGADPMRIERWWSAQIALKACRKAARRFVDRVVPIPIIQRLLVGLHALHEAYGDNLNSRIGINLLAKTLAPLEATDLLSETLGIATDMGMEIRDITQLQHFMEAVLQLLCRAPDDLLRSILWNMKPVGSSRSVIRPAEVAAFLAASDPLPQQARFQKCEMQILNSSEWYRTASGRPKERPKPAEEASNDTLYHVWEAGPGFWCIRVPRFTNRLSSSGGRTACG
ncbi:hypothetical protein CEUSTIGMA_g3881.t1 [Chlamydomonas eustigma]|uniref:Protein kinase domain-containing protein n=1 Tax=Chlamydomonas eustigma TaxID=1157962 RepID=A0A250X054_9CHLO|nr:hypothetical protein CEUSTIGMA_g3881.t1 [Chlamydomonas eustigma]|eukprot:GAX76436.1 hypothetical protein CEUSTIGMA_g3881.t1 [Chlamydomonas eustigma]